MEKNANMQEKEVNPMDETEPIVPVMHVSPSPHLVQTATSTRRMMVDVLVALAPVVAMSLFVFRGYALFQLAVCLGGSLLAELLFVKMRGRSSTLKDCSAIVTGIILAMSLPGTAPWYVGLIAAFVAIGIGKIIFGGLGMNLFNPAMVGRAFVMISFAGALAASGFEDARSAVDAISQATPMNALR
jgi:electron transport complex protein RnfD